MKKGIFWCANFDTERPELITVRLSAKKRQFKGASAVQFEIRQ